MATNEKETKALVKAEHQQSLYPSRDEWAIMKEQAGLALKTGFLPQSVKTPEQALTIAMKGRELGLGLMEAFDSIYVVNGRPGYSAQFMLSRIFGKIPGAGIDYIESSDKACRIVARRPGCKPMEFSFTIEDAAKAGLAAKDNWKKYARAMLRSRCVAEMTRAYFPDCLSGAYTPEELGDPTYAETEDGVIDVTATAPKQIEQKPVTVEEIAEDAAELFDGSVEDGINVDQPVESIDWGIYAIQYPKSKHNGKTLMSLGKTLLANYLKWLEKDSPWIKNRRDFPPEVQQDIEAIKFFLVEKPKP